jgi:hypothetical protein
MRSSVRRRFRQLDESQLPAPTNISRDERMDLDKAIGRLALKDRRIVTSWIDGHTAQEIVIVHGENASLSRAVFQEPSLL